MINKINSTILFSVSLLFSVGISNYKSNNDLIDCNNYSEATKIYCSINHLENSNYVLKYISELNSNQNIYSIKYYDLENLLNKQSLLKNIHLINELNNFYISYDWKQLKFDKQLDFEEKLSILNQRYLDEKHDFENQVENLTEIDKIFENEAYNKNKEYVTYLNENKPFFFDDYKKDYLVR